MRSFNKQ